MKRDPDYYINWIIIGVTLLGLLGASIKHANAGDFKLTHGGTYNMNLPETALSYDGTKRDVSKHYKSSTPTLYVGGRYITDDNLTRITTTYDNGYNAPKYNMQRSVNVKVERFVPLSENMYVAFDSSYKFGGDTKHTSCSDDYNRQYYCGNATAWSDFNQKESQDGENYSVGVRFIFSF